MKISQLNTVELSNKGQPFKLLLPTGKPSGVTLHLLGVDSATYRKRLADYRAALIKDQASAAQGLDEELKAVAMACTVTWEGLEDEKGEPLPCTADNIAEFYESCPWAVQPVNTFIGDRANFLPAVLEA